MAKFYVGIICDDTIYLWIREAFTICSFYLWFYRIVPLEGSIVEVKFGF